MQLFVDAVFGGAQESDKSLVEMSYKSDKSKRVSHNSGLVKCLRRLSYKSLCLECPTIVFHECVTEECQTNVSYKDTLFCDPRCLGSLTSVTSSWLYQHGEACSYVEMTLF